MKEEFDPSKAITRFDFEDEIEGKGRFSEELTKEELENSLDAARFLLHELRRENGIKKLAEISGYSEETIEKALKDVFFKSYSEIWSIH